MYVMKLNFEGDLIVGKADLIVGKADLIVGKAKKLGALGLKKLKKRFLTRFSFLCNVMQFL